MYQSKDNEMSNLWFNVRFGTRHWQWGPDGMNFRVNPYWIENPPDKWFAVYCLFGKHY